MTTDGEYHDPNESTALRALRLCVQQLAAQVQQLQANDHQRANELESLRARIENRYEH